MVSKIKTVYVDLDGTILDIKKRYHKVYSDILTGFGHKPLSQNAFWLLKRSRSKNSFILAKTSSQKHKGMFFKKWIQNIESRAYLKSDTLQPNAKKALSNLSKNRLVLVTVRKSRSNLLWQLKSLGIRKYFDEILSKPAKPPAWKQKLSLIKGDNAEDKSVIIGDSDAEALAAFNLKIPCISLRSGLRNKDELKKLKPFAIVNNIYEAYLLYKKRLQ